MSKKPENVINMKLSTIKSDEFALWLQMRNEVYGALSPGFHEKEMSLIFDREDWFCFFLMGSHN